MNPGIWIAPLFAFCATLVLTPAVRDACLTLGLVDRPDLTRKSHRKPIPRFGGVAIWICYALSFGLLKFLPHQPVLSRSLTQMWLLLPAAVVLFATGFLDDLRGMKASHKLAGQVIAAVLAYWVAGVRIPMFADYPLGVVVSFPVTVIWLLGCTNAFNLIDGVDGLAAGLGLFATTTTLLAALTHGNLEMVVLTLPLAAALLGFLRYNFNPASIFLGDSGSLLIGFLLGCFGVLWSQKSATLLGVTAPLMAMAIPLLDISVSIVRRFIRKQPIFGADRGHIHHRLLDRGFTPRRVSLLLYGVGAIGATLSLLQNVATNQFGGLIVVLFCAGSWIGVQHLGFSEFGAAGKLFTRFRVLVDLHVRLSMAKVEMEKTETLQEFWEVVVRGCGVFGFRSVRLRLQDHIFEAGPAENPELLQLRISLPHDQYICFEREFGELAASDMDAGFVQVVAIALRPKLALFEAEVSRFKEDEIAEAGGHFANVKQLRRASAAGW